MELLGSKNLALAERLLECAQLVAVENFDFDLIDFGLSRTF